MAEKKLRVLLAERAPGEISESLQGLFPEPDSRLELSVVSTLPTLLATVELASPEVILLDLSLGRPDPLDAVRRVHRSAPSIPLIIVADRADKEYPGRCLVEGSSDCLLKGFIDASALEKSLRRALERNTLEGLADLLRDELTGLYNHDGFVILGTRAMEGAAQSGGTLVLLCARIENLGAIREKFGKAAAEQSLRDAAGLLRSCFRRSDLLARLGEAHFAALAMDAAEPSAPILRQRVESRLAIQSAIGQPWNPPSLRMSVGYWGGNDPRSFAAFLDAVELDLRQPEVLLILADTTGTKA